ncbi:hypothetical protein [Fluviispira multicolorata]|uniref:Indole-3-glycerol-phosphate synthase n=1 Tax=Fluviispira multicolorata TaxID=2654512 RepID=A0A833N735_9BACT|nr:hypothetical protein [Fluviispira multicolorata]KAB8031780.1 hypothetical protein GCL57_03835 [Fluviispira multicolorata]
MLDFFLSQQNNLTNLKEKNISLELIKEQCEINYFKKENLSSFSQAMKSSCKRKNIPHIILDQEFRTLFSANNNIKFDAIEENIFSLFTSELSSHWKDLMICKSEESFVIRSGFYTNEYEIYESILFGFNGMMLYCKGLDKFKIQYFTEIGRDFHFSIFFIIQNKTELQTVLETDAPYFAISGFNPLSFSPDYNLLLNISNLIPKTAEIIAYIGKYEDDKIKILQDIGYEYIIHNY